VNILRCCINSGYLCKIIAVVLISAVVITPYKHIYEESILFNLIGFSVLARTSGADD
jgi:hypothetical protein